MTTIYTKPQIDAMAVKIGGEIKAAKTTVTQVQGQSTTYAVSQKMITDSLSAFGTAATKNVGTGADQVPLSSQVPSLLGYAATRNVGVASGNLAEYSAYEGLSGLGYGGNTPATLKFDWSDSVARVQFFRYVDRKSGSVSDHASGLRFMVNNASVSEIYVNRLASSTSRSNLFIRSIFDAGTSNMVVQQEQMVYTTGNTTKDAATGFLKVSSPVLHVYNDKIDKIHEAEQLDITVDKKGVGHYEIHGTTGLRKNDGWFMSPPRDVHGNVLCMVDLEEKDGVVALRTYKKKFDFETVSIVHDYDNPMDIPDGVCVEFRFNDLPQDDTQTEV